MARYFELDFEHPELSRPLIDADLQYVDMLIANGRDGDDVKDILPRSLGTPFHARVEVNPPSSDSYRSSDWHIDHHHLDVLEIFTTDMPTCYFAGHLAVKLTALEPFMPLKIVRNLNAQNVTDIARVLTVISTHFSQYWPEETLSDPQAVGGLRVEGGSIVQGLPYTMQRGVNARTLHRSATIPTEYRNESRKRLITRDAR